MDILKNLNHRLSIEEGGEYKNFGTHGSPRDRLKRYAIHC